jgi:hypothetical protein
MLLTTTTPIMGLSKDGDKKTPAIICRYNQRRDFEIFEVTCRHSKIGQGQLYFVLKKRGSCNITVILSFYTDNF